MAIEIAEQKKVNVLSSDRDFLLKVKNGDFEYEELLQLANEKYRYMEQAFDKSDLPENPNVDYIQNLTVNIRTNLYN